MSPYCTATRPDAGRARGIEVQGNGYRERERRPAPLRIQGRRARQTIIGNAATFVDECGDPQQLAFDLEWLKGFSKPVLLTTGERSPPIFAPVIRKLAETVPHAAAAILPDTGHVPHATHPDPYVDTLLAFARKHFRDADRRDA